MSTVNEKMTDIADAIRSVTGITSKLGIDEIVNEIEDLAGGVSKNYKTGSFTQSSTNSTPRQIRHGLGRVPQVLILFKLDPKLGSANSIDTSVTDKLFYAFFNGKGIYSYFNSYYSSSSTTNRVSNSYYYSNITNPLENTNTSRYFTDINSEYFSTPTYLTEDDEYAWIAIKGV